MIDELFDYNHQHLFVLLTLSLFLVHSLHCLLVEGFQGEDGTRLTFLSLADVGLEDTFEFADLVVELLCDFLLELESGFANGCDLVYYGLYFDLKVQHFLNEGLVLEQLGLDLLSLGLYQSLELLFQLLLLFYEGFADGRDDSLHVLLQSNYRMRECLICIIQSNTHFRPILIFFNQRPFQFPEIIIQRSHLPPRLKIRSLNLLLNLHEILTGGYLRVTFHSIPQDLARLSDCIQFIEQPSCLIFEIA